MNSKNKKRGYTDAEYFNTSYYTGNKFDRHRGSHKKSIGYSIGSKFQNPQPMFNKFDAFDIVEVESELDKVPLNKDYNLNLDVNYTKLINQSTFFT